MKKGLKEVVFILDRSGSMQGLESDTIGGYNSMLDEHKVGDGEVLLSLVLFDDRFQVIHNRQDIKSVPHLTKREYFVRGSTALYDAIGRSISKINAVQNRLPEAERSEKIIFVIMTDGYENASREFHHAEIQRLITRHKQLFGWEFLFLGANIDVDTVAQNLGIDAHKAAHYQADSKGTRKNFKVMSEMIHEVRTHDAFSSNLKQRIENE